jgi:hypothetical protein
MNANDDSGVERQTVLRPVERGAPATHMQVGLIRSPMRGCLALCSGLAALATIGWFGLLIG